MMESFKIYQVIRKDQEYNLSPVDYVPADSVCTVYIGGNGIVNENRGLRLGQIVEREILQDVADIPNYVVVYDALDVADNRPERLVEMSRHANDVLPRTDLSAVIYLNEKNLNDVYRRRILPIFINGGPRGLGKIQFAIDGDNEEIVSRLIEKIRRTMQWLNFSSNAIFPTLNLVLAHCYPYSDFTPNYPHEMFEKILLPRISGSDGKRIDTDTALRRVRKMNIFAQCHGGHVVRVMEQDMAKMMAQMGYSAIETSNIMSQVLVTAYAPSCALGNSKFQFIGFMSVYDYVVDVPNNWVYRYISNNRLAEAERYSNGVKDWKWNFAPIFLSGKNGNIFLVKQRFEHPDGPNNIGNNEHNNAHYFPYDATYDGQLLAILARNIIINGIKNSLSQDDGYKPLPPINELVLDGENDAELHELITAMTAAGDKFMGDVYEYAKQHNPEIHPVFETPQYKRFTEIKR